jgi:hypothetical protein
LYSIGTICTGVCLAPGKKLEFMALHEIIPKLLWNSLLLLWKASCDDGPICDDMHVLLNK